MRCFVEKLRLCSFILDSRQENRLARRAMILEFFRLHQFDIDKLEVQHHLTRTLENYIAS